MKNHRLEQLCQCSLLYFFLSNKLECCHAHNDHLTGFAINRPTRHEVSKRNNAFVDKTQTISNTKSTVFLSQTSNVEHKEQIEFNGKKYAIDRLSVDPVVYTISDFMEPSECETLINYTKDLSRSGREMIKSNPPEVSISIKKLWPLSILSFFAGFPPVIRLYSNTEYDDVFVWDQILQAALPNIIIASLLSIALTFITFQLISKVSSERSRTSDALAFNNIDDMPCIKSLVSKACGLCGLSNYSWKNFEAPVITRYDAGAVFATHNDASPTKGSEWKDLGKQRVVTLIVYLTTVGNGGETSFDRLNFEVKPKQGKALVFYPSDSETLEADDRTRHESKVTLEGEEEKWIIQLFGRYERVPPPLGISDEFHDVIKSSNL